MWVAQRIPDDHVGISANIPRIGKVDFNDKENFMIAVIQRQMQRNGFGMVKRILFSTRWCRKKTLFHTEFYVFSTLAPSLGLEL